MQTADDYRASCQMVLEELRAALDAVDPREVEALVTLALSKRKIFFVGVGRVLLSLQAVAKRWAHLGLATHVVGEITEPAISKEDLLIVGSGSGGSLFPVAIAKKAHGLGVPIVHIGSNPESPIAKITSLMLRIPVPSKAQRPDEIASGQPMTSLFEQALLLLGDVMATMIIARQGIQLDSLWQHHANLE